MFGVGNGTPMSGVSAAGRILPQRTVAAAAGAVLKAHGPTTFQPVRGRAQNDSNLLRSMPGTCCKTLIM